MKRKDFFAAAALTFSSAAAFSRAAQTSVPNSASKPPYVKTGDTVGITSAAGFITADDCRDCINALEGWGLQVRLGKSPGNKHFNFGGTDEERLSDLQQMLDDDSISAVMVARGGYGIVRIIDRIDFDKFRKQPKWVIGFSDVTVLHAHINSRLNIATIHSKMCNSFVSPQTADPVQVAAINSLRPCLFGEEMIYTAAAHQANKNGSADGLLVGGNLKTIESLIGTKSELETRNKILFLEDTGEYLYSIDRMFRHLQRSGTLSRLKGLIIGGFKVKPDEEGEEFGRSVEHIVLESVGENSYPICFNFPVGHQKDNRALRCGIMHSLTVSAAGTTLKSLE